MFTEAPWMALPTCVPECSGTTDVGSASGERRLPNRVVHSNVRRGPKATQTGGPAASRPGGTVFGVTVERGDRPVLRLVRPHSAPSASRRRVNLAHAVERHLAGQDGLTDQQFLVLHATGRFPLALVPLPPRR